MADFDKFMATGKSPIRSAQKSSKISNLLSLIGIRLQKGTDWCLVESTSDANSQMS